MENFCRFNESKNCYLNNCCNNCNYYSERKNKLKIEESNEVKRVKIVRKMEDLMGLENGNGLYTQERDVIREGEYITVLVVMFKGEGFYEFEYGEPRQEDLAFLKAMGFEFEYKPLRTIDEVLEEIEDLQHERFLCGDENYFVSLDVEKNKYEVSYNRYYKNITCVYLKKETAQKYADELNEIIGVNNK